MNYKILRTKILFIVVSVSLSLILLIEFYHYQNRKKVFYDVSMEKLLIFTKTMRSFEKRELQIYKARFTKIETKKKLLEAISEHNLNTIREYSAEIYKYFKLITPNLEHLHLYDTDGKFIYTEDKHYLLLKDNFKISDNPVLQKVLKTKKLVIGYVKTSDNLYYRSIISPIIFNNKIIAYQEFGIKASSLFEFASKAGRYKYVLYLSKSTQSNQRELGVEVASNSQIFSKLNMTQDFIYKNANQDNLIKIDNKYYLLYQYDIETRTQRNFAQVILASNITQYVQDNDDTVKLALQFSLIILLFMALIVYLILTKLVNRLINEEKELHLKQNQIEVIMNNSDSLISLFENGKLVLINNTLMKFIGCSDIKTCISKNHNLNKLFIHDRDTYWRETSSNNMEWIEEILALDEKDKVIALRHHEFGINYFSVKITKIPEQLGSNIVIFSNITSIFKKSKKDEYLANHDILTNIYNRQYFNEIVSLNIFNAMQSKQTSTLLMLDIDFFKRVNDNFGHQVGDDVLVQFSHIISSNIRTRDIFARWGGEEFVLLLMDTTQDAGFKVANSLREKIQKENFKIANTITCSIGLSEYIENDSIDSWLARVDEALYKAKNSGRNKVEVL